MREGKEVRIQYLLKERGGEVVVETLKGGWESEEGMGAAATGQTQVGHTLSLIESHHLTPSSHTI